MIFMDTNTRLEAINKWLSLFGQPMVIGLEDI